MYLEISNPMDYHAALYIRLSKEDEKEGPSESVTNQKSLLNAFNSLIHIPFTPNFWGTFSYALNGIKGYVSAPFSRFLP